MTLPYGDFACTLKVNSVVDTMWEVYASCVGLQLLEGWEVKGELQFEERMGTMVSSFQAFDFSWLVKSGVRTGGPSRDMRILWEYKEKLMVGKIRDFGVKVVVGIVGPGMCLLVPFFILPTPPLGQHSWGTEYNNGQWQKWHEKIWLSCKFQTFVTGTGCYFPFSKWIVLLSTGEGFDVSCLLRITLGLGKWTLGEGSPLPYYIVA